MLRLLFITAPIFYFLCTYTTSTKDFKDYSYCQLTNETIDIAIEQLIERKLVPEKDTLTARVAFSCNWLLKPDTLEAANKIIYKNLTYGGIRPSILFTDISIGQAHLKIYFTSFSGGIQNNGTVNFECINNNYVFNEITYKRGNE